MADTLEKNENEQKEELPRSVFARLKRWYHELPDKKRYLEFITALLTIPVLLTVIISNVQNLQKQNTASTTPTLSLSPSPTGAENHMPPREPKNQLSPTPTTTPSPTPSAQCKKEVGPVAISYPEEGSTITSDPVSIEITRTGDDYCAVVWSYRINGGAWSEYTDKSIAIYGLNSGKKNVEVKVKSIVTGTETLLTRTFTIVGMTPSPTSTASANF